MAFTFSLSVTLALVRVVLSAAIQHRASSPESLFTTVVYGDSYSDNGNVYKLTNETWPALPVYYEGRFSNGPTWAENFANFTRSNLTDLAFGGATSDNILVQGYTGANSTIPVPSAVDQILSYLSSDPTANVSNSLHIVLVGLNDIFFNTSLTVDEVVGKIADGVNDLQSAGATHIALANMPDLGALPIIQFTDTETTNIWRNFSVAFSPALRTLANQVNASFIDFYSFFETVFDDPEQFGFNATVTYDSCLTGAYGETSEVTLCDDPDQYVFWDAYHPTAKMHTLLAEFAIQSLIF